MEREGSAIVHAAYGVAGFDRALTMKPDLLLVDLRLPGMTGMQIYQQLRAASIRTPIIVPSAIGEEVDKVLLT